MSSNQLDTLFKFESDKEQKAAQQLQLAERDYQDNLLRLQSIGDFRLEYMRRLNQRSIEGIDSSTYRHFHAFVTKLDNAAEQVEIAIRQAKALVEKRKQEWFEQRRKVQAVEHLLLQRQTLQRQKSDKLEQAMLDEIALQQFVRKKRSI